MVLSTKMPVKTNHRHDRWHKHFCYSDNLKFSRLHMMWNITVCTWNIFICNIISCNWFSTCQCNFNTDSLMLQKNDFLFTVMSAVQKAARCFFIKNKNNQTLANPWTLLFKRAFLKDYEKTKAGVPSIQSKFSAFVQVWSVSTHRETCFLAQSS